MPLMKKGSASAVLPPPAAADVVAAEAPAKGGLATPPASAPAAAAPAKKLGGTRKLGDKADAPMTKDDYWRRREERDFDTQVHIRRSGAWQAAIQSMGLLQLNTNNTLEDYLKLVEQAALRGIEFINKA